MFVQCHICSVLRSAFMHVYLGSITMKRALSPPIRSRCIHPARDRITDIEDAVMDQSNSINIGFCRSLGVKESFLEEWSHGVVLEGANLAPPFDVPNYPGLLAHADEAAAELDRLTALGKIYWYPSGCAPQDLDIAPANIIIKAGKHRIVHDWSKPGLNQFLVVPPVNYGTMDGFISKLKPNQHMAGLDFQDCFLHWPIHWSCRRRLGLRHPITGQLGVFLYLAFGLGPAPGINDRNVSEAVRAALTIIPGLLNDTFVDDLRLTNDHSTFSSEDEDRELLFFRLCELKSTLELMGFQIHHKAGKFIPPTQRIDWIGWMIASDLMLVIMTDSKAAKGAHDSQALLAAAASPGTASAKALMSFLGFLNFVAQVIRQVDPYTRAISRALVRAGVYRQWQRGNRRHNPQVALTAEMVADIKWTEAMFLSKPHRKIHHLSDCTFLWHRKLPNISAVRDTAWRAGTLVILGLDASSGIGWGATLGDHSCQGKWSDADQPQHINWKELKSYDLALDHFAPLLINKIVYIKSDNMSAIHYINSGRGRFDELSALAHSIRLKEVRLAIESVAVHVPGAVNLTPDALSRYYIDVEFADKHPHRTLRRRLFQQLHDRHGFTVDGMSADDGHNSLLTKYFSPSYPFFEQDLKDERVWLFPPCELATIIVKHVANLHKASLFTGAILLSSRSAQHSSRHLANAAVLQTWIPGADLFRELSGDQWRSLPPIRGEYIVYGFGLQQVGYNCLEAF